MTREYSSSTHWVKPGPVMLDISCAQQTLCGDNDLSDWNMHLMTMWLRTLCVIESPRFCCARISLLKTTKSLTPGLEEPARLACSVVHIV